MSEKSIDIRRSIREAYGKLIIQAKEEIKAEVWEDTEDDLEAELFGRIIELPKDRRDRLIEAVRIFGETIDKSHPAAG